MSQSGPATVSVAKFEIFLTRFLDADGTVKAELPAFAKDAAQLKAMYRWMLVTRAFDKKAVALQRTGQLGTYAACLGQEAIGVALGYAMKPEDIFIPAYREYACQFIRGVKMRDVLLYWGGDERGMLFEGSKSPHDFPLSVPIGTHVPHAIGVGYALKLKKEPRVAVVSCGDGATSKGDFYEAVSSAKVWNLPIVFLVNNNQWAISLPINRQTGAQTLAQKGLAGGLHSEQVDGNDVIATRFVLERAIERARSGGGPGLVEAITYRLHDHTTADDARRYRSEEEVKAAWEKDPVKRLKTYLMAQKLWTEDEEKQATEEGTVKAEAAAKEFTNFPPEPPEAVFDHLYASLPRQLQWQREEVKAAGPKGGHH